jgi:hypothetical protein
MTDYETASVIGYRHLRLTADKVSTTAYVYATFSGHPKKRLKIGLKFTKRLLPHSVQIGLEKRKQLVPCYPLIKRNK